MSQIIVPGTRKRALTPFIVLLCVCLPFGAATAETPSPARQNELRNLLLQDCGSCHGMRLTGGLGPALTPQSLQGKSRELLIATVSEGRPGTPMPPWKPLLSESEIAWLVDYISGTEKHP